MQDKSLYVVMFMFMCVFFCVKDILTVLAKLHGQTTWWMGAVRTTGKPWLIGDVALEDKVVFLKHAG